MYSKQNVGNAGEYYFASILSANDFIATITLGRAEKYDILAVNNKGKSFKFSVKTRFFKVNRCLLSEKDETGGTDDFYYAFIRLNQFKEEPDYWVVPSKRVNQLIKGMSDIYFRDKRKRDGTLHNDAGIRVFPLETNNANRDMWPKDWKEELESYYKNIKQLAIPSS